MATTATVEPVPMTTQARDGTVTYTAHPTTTGTGAGGHGAHPGGVMAPPPGVYHDRHEHIVPDPEIHDLHHATIALSIMGILFSLPGFIIAVASDTGSYYRAWVAVGVPGIISAVGALLLIAGSYHRGAEKFGLLIAGGIITVVFAIWEFVGWIVFAANLSNGVDQGPAWSVGLRIAFCVLGSSWLIIAGILGIVYGSKLEVHGYKDTRRDYWHRAPVTGGPYGSDPRIYGVERTVFYGDHELHGRSPATAGAVGGHPPVATYPTHHAASAQPSMATQPITVATERTAMPTQPTTVTMTEPVAPAVVGV
eukprot:TRINITY_DN11875_c0_g1_i3.p1 TRINITY_DN11875_c0_g1~~TRINITY_DN11875_c0_g1_i3.p1  ORF type:complete len:309 (+),score=67.86 TRINITY_DN11875_c0_g1_i3:670-1596(+)